jgi:hypothetical protein
MLVAALLGSAVLCGAGTTAESWADAAANPEVVMSDSEKASSAVSIINGWLEENPAPAEGFSTVTVAPDGTVQVTWEGDPPDGFTAVLCKARRAAPVTVSGANVSAAQVERAVRAVVAAAPRLGLAFKTLGPSAAGDRIVIGVATQDLAGIESRLGEAVGRLAGSIPVEFRADASQLRYAADRYHDTVRS